MEAAIKSGLTEYSQSMSNWSTQLTAEQQANEILLERTRRTKMETLEFLDETLKRLREDHPFITSTEDLIAFKRALCKSVDELRRKRDTALSAKQEKLASRDDKGNKLIMIKKDIEMLMEENHNIEEKLKLERDDLPLILKLMGSLSSVPKSPTPTVLCDEGDSIAKHLESLLKQVEGL